MPQRDSAACCVLESLLFFTNDNVPRESHLGQKANIFADGLCFLLEVAFLVHASFLFVLLLCLLVDLGGAFLAYKSNQEKANVEFHDSANLVSNGFEY